MAQAARPAQKLDASKLPNPTIGFGQAEVPLVPSERLSTHR